MTQWRNNQFAAKCCECQQALEPNYGFYRISETRGRLFYCLLHKEDYDERPHEPPEQPNPFTRNQARDPAPPPAPGATMEIDVDTLAQRTADLTFGKVADHFIGHVMPEVKRDLPALVTAELAKLVRVAEIQVGKAPKVKVGRAHKMLPTIVQAVVAGAQPSVGR